MRKNGCSWGRSHIRIRFFKRKSGLLAVVIQWAEIVWAPNRGKLRIKCLQEGNNCATCLYGGSGFPSSQRFDANSHIGTLSYCRLALALGRRISPANYSWQSNPQTCRFLHHCPMCSSWALLDTASCFNPHLSWCLSYWCYHTSLLFCCACTEHGFWAKVRIGSPCCNPDSETYQHLSLFIAFPLI